jgi:hypothetical protein
VRVLFLNQYFPPDPAPTGIVLRELANALAAAGHEVAFASSGQDYRGGQGRGSRMRRELQGLWRLFRAGLEAGRVDAVVSATSPPLQVVLGAVLAKLRGARHYHWLFDMYPELATALGELREGTLTRLFSAAARWAYRGADCVVALDEDMAERLKGYGVTARIIAPWVFQSLIDARAGRPLAGEITNDYHGYYRTEDPNAAGVSRPGAPDADEPGRPPPPAFAPFVLIKPEPVWLYSGNLGRAHEWRTLLDAQRLIEAAGLPWRLVFQGGGPAWPAAREYAAGLGLARCDWRPYVAEEELPASLLAADVLIITQKPETCGLLWPSKLALATSLPRPILWVGPTDRAIARYLEKLPQAAIFAPADAEGVAKWLADAGSTRGGVTRDPVAIRAASIQQWVKLVSGEGRCV